MAMSELHMHINHLSYSLGKRGKHWTPDINTPNSLRTHHILCKKKILQ